MMKLFRFAGLRKLINWQLHEDYYQRRINVNPSNPDLPQSSSKYIRGIFASFNSADMGRQQEALPL